MRVMTHHRLWIGFCVAVAFALSAVAFVGLRTAPAWPSAFCQPVSRIVGVDATMTMQKIPSLGQNSASGTEDVDYVTLHHDIGEALAYAPTRQLRDELAAYQRASGTVTYLELTNALSRFDSQARTQLQRCGIHPIGK